MKSVKKYLSFLIVAVLLLSSITAIASDSQEVEFNKYGFKELNLQKELDQELNGISLFSLSKDWEDFGTEYNIPLEKKWTVEFSGSFDYSSIAAVAIADGNEFIPVKISKTGDDKLVVFPLDKFAGNKTYSLRIVLENGKRYKKDFVTKKEYREADIEPNDTILNASRLYLNEKIIGNITEGDNDYFKIEVAKEGTLELDLLSLEEKGLSLHLYGEDFEKGYMR